MQGQIWRGVANESDVLRRLEKRGDNNTLLASTHDSGEKILRHFARVMRLSRQQLVPFLYSRDGRATNGGAAARTIPAIALLARIAQGGRDEQGE